jgi:hypothetical protein
MRTYDVLGFTTWGWTPILGLDVAGIREVIATFGENVIALCDLFNGNQAIYHSPDNGDSRWANVLEVAEIYDITSLSTNWTLASTSDGYYSSLKSGSSWDLICPVGAGVPVARSMVWIKKTDQLFVHTGDSIWLSDNKGAEGSWDQVCDLTVIQGYLPNNIKYNSIDGYPNSIIATCGYALVNSIDDGGLGTWDELDLTTVIRDWQYVQPSQPIWRQVVFWYTTDPPTPIKAHWMISAILGDVHIIRTYVNRGLGYFSPVVDMALSERHRLNKSARLNWENRTQVDSLLMISGDRRIEGELKHALTTSTDGIIFEDVLAGTSQNINQPSSPELDIAHAGLTAMTMPER